MKLKLGGSMNIQLILGVVLVIIGMAMNFGLVLKLLKREPPNIVVILIMLCPWAGLTILLAELLK
jgi:hypothetical protein